MGMTLITIPPTLYSCHTLKHTQLWPPYLYPCMSTSVRTFYNMLWQEQKILSNKHYQHPYAKRQQQFH